MLFGQTPLTLAPGRAVDQPTDAGLSILDLQPASSREVGFRHQPKMADQDIMAASQGSQAVAIMPVCQVADDDNMRTPAADVASQQPHQASQVRGR